MGINKRAIKAMFPREKWRILRGDSVYIAAGKDKGQTGTVTKVIRDTRIPKAFVQGRNLVSDFFSSDYHFVVGPLSLVLTIRECCRTSVSSSARKIILAALSPLRWASRQGCRAYLSSSSQSDLPVCKFVGVNQNKCGVAVSHPLFQSATYRSCDWIAGAGMLPLFGRRRQGACTLKHQYSWIKY